jgi:hypothetical protein
MTVNIILTDKEDGTLGVQIIAEPGSEGGVSQAAAVMFLEMLQNMQRAKIITES